MKSYKVKMIVAALACLLITGASEAQFGKLKSMVKDKLSGNKDSSAVTSVAKGKSSEVKATYAPGVKKIVSVKRQSEGTPEVQTSTHKGGAPEIKASPVQGGKKQDVAIKVAKIDAREFDAIRGYAPCDKISAFQILSATQVKVTIDLTGKDASSCSLSFNGNGSTLATTELTIKKK